MTCRFVFIWTIYRLSCVLPCTRKHCRSHFINFGLGGRARLHQDKVWESRGGAGCMHDVCVPDEPLVSLPVYLVDFTNKLTSSKSLLGTCAFFSITVRSDLFPFLASAVFFSLFIFALVNGIYFSMSALLHFSLLPARRLTHAVIHGRITGAASAFEASLLERWLPGLKGLDAGTTMHD